MLISSTRRYEHDFLIWDVTPNSLQKQMSRPTTTVTARACAVQLAPPDRGPESKAAPRAGLLPGDRSRFCLLGPQQRNARGIAAGPAGAQARSAALAGRPQAGQPHGVRHQLGSAASARHRDDGPNPATRQGKPLPRPIGTGALCHGAHCPIFPLPPIPGPAGADLPWPIRPRVTRPPRAPGHAQRVEVTEAPGAPRSHKAV
jgi:hypothetical protein